MSRSYLITLVGAFRPMCSALFGLAFAACSPGQFTPAASAIKLPDSLLFTNPLVAASGSVVWSPTCGLYYSSRVGNATFPLETWPSTGGLSTFQTTTGQDLRGMWWNPNLSQVECNLFSAAGWATMPVNGTCQATSLTAANILFPGMNQPVTQSVGAYDHITNTVLFYNAGSLFVYSRTTAGLVATIPLTGTTLTNIAQYTVIYTGQLGYEVGLLNYTTKRVLLFNRATGVFSGVSQLPATAVTPATGFGFSYANQRVWLFNSSLRKWNAYCIWQQNCAMVLPVELLSSTATCTNGRPELSWITASERDNSHFVIERSGDAQTWRSVGQVAGVGDSQQVTEYSWRDEAPLSFGTAYYRLIQVDLGGGEEVLPMMSVEPCSDTAGPLSVLPNPTSGPLQVMWHAQRSAVPITGIRVLDSVGRTHQAIRLGAEERGAVSLDLSGAAAGTYTVLGLDAQGVARAHARVVRQ